MSHVAATAFVLAALLGLSLGGLTTIWSYRLPTLLRRRWRGRAACPARAGAPATRWWRAWPVIGWWLVGRHDGRRRRPGHAWYRPWPELLLAALFCACVWRFGPGWLALAAMAYCLALVCMAWVDWRSYILPDALTLPLLWGGLLVNLDGALVPLSHAVLGAALGYGFLWLFFLGFKGLTGREGMGYGDFKLTAALGAWLGLGMLPLVLLLACLTGVVVGLVDWLRVGRDRPRPFAPCLALAGIGGLMWRPEWAAWF